MAGKVMVVRLTEMVGLEVELLALVREKRRVGGERALVLSVYDVSGEAEVELMDKSRQDEVDEEIRQGDLVRILGRVGKLGDKVRVYATEIERAPKEEAPPDHFLPSASRPREEMVSELRSLLSTIKEPHLRALCEEVFGDPEFLERFSIAPGAKMVHHARLGGLLEHTLEVARMCEEVARIYPELDRDLLLSAALLHDVGKVVEYSWDLRIERTDEGKLLGHVVLGAFIVAEKIRKVEGFPEDLRVRLLHCILAHMGKEEHGSPVRPMIPEAFVLYHVDHMLAHTSRSLEMVADLKKKGQSWLSKRDWVLGSIIYAGKGEAER
ncbi:MAG TPA: HD domain-containing protein [Armatimonadetes bacterium]|nr:HD domain-containing protein [Armatimonadota bacterium]